VTLIAHAGHWLPIVGYFSPVILLVLWLVFTQIRERRRSDAAGAESAPVGAEAG
jgi:hypothetical protein